MTIDPDISTAFGNKLRVRSCGFLMHGDRMLLIKHEGLGKSGHLWLPPGGAVDFGDSLSDTLEREFKEETNLIVKAEELLFTQEYIEPPLHAVEFFFKVVYCSGEARLGYDPELSTNRQILSSIKWFNEDELKVMDCKYLHHSFSKVRNPFDVLDLKTHLICREI